MVGEVIRSGERPFLVNEHVANETIICQFTIPFKNILKVPNLQASIISNQTNGFISGFFSVEPQFQLQYLKTLNGCNRLFIGVQCDVSFDFSNLSKPHHQKPHMASARIFNTMGKIYRTQNDSGCTLSVGRIWKVQNTELGTFANIEVGITKYQLQTKDVSFQLECRGPSAMLVSNQKLYLTSKPTVSYEFFPFAKSAKYNLSRFTPETNKLSAISSNSDVILTKQGNSFSSGPLASISISQKIFFSQNGRFTRSASIPTHQSWHNFIESPKPVQVFKNIIKCVDFEYGSSAPIASITEHRFQTSRSQRIEQQACVGEPVPSTWRTPPNSIYGNGLTGLYGIILWFAIRSNRNKIVQFFQNFKKANIRSD